MKKSVFVVAMSLLITATLLSCDPKSPFKGYTPTGTGLYYKEIVKGTGNQLQQGDIIFPRLAYYINDSLLFTTADLPEPAVDQVHESAFSGDIYEAFAMMHVGDSMSFMINADSTFKKQFRVSELPAFVKPGDFLRWEVVIDNAMNEEAYYQMKQEEQQKLQEEQAILGQQSKEEFAAWLAANGVKAKPSESGLVYVCTKKGKGPKPGYKQTVKVHYTGKLLDGTVFDSSVERGEPIAFSLGVGQVIKGWDEGIALMSKGEKGILYIPYDLAYGPRQNGPIPAFANLIFEVELVDFE